MYSAFKCPMQYSILTPTSIPYAVPYTCAYPVLYAVPSTFPYPFPSVQWGLHIRTYVSFGRSSEIQHWCVCACVCVCVCACACVCACVCVCVCVCACRNSLYKFSIMNFHCICIFTSKNVSILPSFYCALTRS